MTETNSYSYDESDNNNSLEELPEEKLVEILEELPKEKLVEMVEENSNMNLIEAAMQELSYKDKSYALKKGIEFLVNNAFDPYFQSCIFDSIYKLDRETVLDCISSRETDIDLYFFKDILTTMIVYTPYEDFINMKNYKIYLSFLLMHYKRYDENEKNEMIDLIKEFKKNFHLNTPFKAPL